MSELMVVIKDFKIPDRCLDCNFYRLSATGLPTCIVNLKRISTEELHVRSDKCPLKEVDVKDAT